MDSRYRKYLAATFLVVLIAAQTILGANDWSKLMVDSTIKRYPTAESLKGWGYAKSLYLYGQYLVYLRTREKKYLDHVQAWSICTSTTKARSIVLSQRSITCCPATSA
jgi:unsaturated rhamnogalacturonyl hydrolase